MKKHKPLVFKIDNEQMLKEQEDFRNQPQEVLEQLRVTKIFMIVFIPLTTVFCYFVNFKISIIIASLVGIIIFFYMFFGLKKTKLSLIPLICIGVGMIFGFIILPMFINSFKEFSR